METISGGGRQAGKMAATDIKIYMMITGGCSGCGCAKCPLDKNECWKIPPVVGGPRLKLKKEKK